MSVLPWLGLAIFTFIWCICLLGWHIATTRYASPHPTPKANVDNLPGVSILRPLRGLDANLYENLESSFKQNFPLEKYEILMSVAEEDDQAIPIVCALQAKYPQVDATLIIGQDPVGLNPKINNMMRSYNRAKFDLLWVLDSNALISKDALSNMVSEFTHSTYTKQPVGMVHHVPFPVYPDICWGSRAEQAFLGCTHAKMYLAINACAIDSCIMGKSTMWRKSDLEKTSPGLNTGLAGYSNYLGEDNMIGNKLWNELHLKHAMNHDVVGNVVGTMSLETFFWRRVRWIRIRKHMTPLPTILEPFTECLLIGIIGSLSLRSLTGLPFLIFYISNLLLWFWVDASVYQSLMKAAPLFRPSPVIYENPHSFTFFQSWFLRELVAFPIWIFAMFGNTVEWRNNEPYHLRTDGTVVSAAKRPPLKAQT